MAKSAIDNPALRCFERQTPDEGPYGAAESTVLWDETAHGIAAVAVAYFPAYRVAAEHPLWERWRAFCKQWDYAFGSISPGWLCGEMACPESLFGYFIATGFASVREEGRAVREFARIDECIWAREPEFLAGDEPVRSSQLALRTLQDRPGGAVPGTGGGTPRRPVPLAPDATADPAPLMPRRRL